MQLNFNTVLWLLALVLLNLSACKKEDDSINNNNNNNNSNNNNNNNNNNSNPLRDEAVNEYNTNYLGSAVTDAQWNGSVSGCDAGTLPQQVHDKVLQRINYFRKAVSIPPVTFNATLNRQCQEAALITLANQVADHYPPPTATCYSDTGFLGCFISNLSYSSHTSRSIDNYMDDWGANNEATGHRHYVLLPQTTEMGHGSTNYSNALGVTEDYDDPLPANVPEFISWPPKNYVAARLVFPRWSFSVPVPPQTALPDYSNTIVTMTDENGSPVSLTVIHRANRLVWEPDNIQTFNPNDVTYHLSITPVIVDGVSKSYSYDVIIFQP